ncbi:MAG: SIR2 family NAD-dependent protein deacylase [Solirubrobacterales bacterium]
METICQESSLTRSASVETLPGVGLGLPADPTATHRQTIDHVAQLLAASRSVLFITGAGISADSGLPTYRGSGLPYNIDCAEDGLCVERALAGDLFEDRPDLTWKYLSRMERMCRDVRYNRAHEVIAEMERHFERVWTLTQNVDGLHRAAGARNVIDIHGDLHNLRCTRCRHRETVSDYSRLTIPPQCPACSNPLRPDILLFGEPLPLEKLMMMLIELDNGFDMVFSIGTSSVFPYAAEPIQTAKALGRPTVEINPGLSEVSDVVDFRLPLRAAPALEAIWSAYRQIVPTGV